MAPEHVVRLVISKTTYSRFESAQSIVMTREWMNLKTVASHFSLAINRTWKLLFWLLGLRCLGNAVLASALIKYFITLYLDVRVDLQLWMGNAPTHFVQSGCIVPCSNL